jgi:large subunit ribosomal protein L25
MAKEAASTHLSATVRTDFGKGAARRTRREGKVPAVLYGPGREPVHLAIPEHPLVMALRHHGRNAALQLSIAGQPGEQIALTRAVQIDPLRRVIEHVDFLAVVAGEHVTSEVPLLVIGEVDRDLIVSQHSNTLNIQAAVEAIPEHITIDVTGLEGGATILASQAPLPAGVTLAGSADEVLVSISAAQRVSAEEDAAASAAGESGAGEAAAEGTES